MESLFIFFTNPGKLIALDYEKDLIKANFYDGKEPKLNKNTPFCLINRNEIKFLHDLELNEPSAFALIAFDFLKGDHDRQEIEEYKMKLSQFAERYKQVYIIYHDNMKRQLSTNFHLDLIEDLKKKGNFKDNKRGMHSGKDSSKRDYYIVAINLFEIVKTKKGKEQLNKKIKEAHELIGEDIELKQKLNLLHKCLTPEGAEDVKNGLDQRDSNYQEIKAEFKKDSKNRQLLDSIIAKDGDKSLSDEYTTPLTNLRENLLNQ